MNCYPASRPLGTPAPRHFLSRFPPLSLPLPAPILPCSRPPVSPHKRRLVLGYNSTPYWAQKVGSVVDKLLLSCPSLQSFLWNLLKSSRHVTSRNQGLSPRRQGRKRREGLGTRLFNSHFQQNYHVTTHVTMTVKLSQNLRVCL